VKLTQLPRRVAGRLKRSASRLAGTDFVAFDEAELPPKNMRYCGASFRDDATFLSSSDSEAERLVNEFGLGDPSRILEIGCGPGRLPIGLIRRVPGIESYHGVDIDQRAIDWCTRHITKKYDNFEFHTVNAQHDRYKPDGIVMDDRFSLPVPDDYFDLVYLHSVFANLIERDIKVYLRVFRTGLRPGGRVFLTAFIEPGVPSATINPDDYVVESSGPLNLVRYDREHLLSLFETSGFTVDRFEHGSELDNQSAVYLTRT